MAYCTQDDLLNQIPETELIGLTDDDNAGEVDAAVTTQAIADADAEIDTYVKMHYAVPLDPVPAIILKCSVDITLYNLVSRRSRRDEVRTERYNNALKFLRAVAAGTVSLGSDDVADERDAAELDLDAPERQFSRDKLGGM